MQDNTKLSVDVVNAISPLSAGFSLFLDLDYQRSECYTRKRACVAKLPRRYPPWSAGLKKGQISMYSTMALKGHLKGFLIFLYG